MYPGVRTTDTKHSALKSDTFGCHEVDWNLSWGLKETPQTAAVTRMLLNTTYHPRELNESDPATVVERSTLSKLRQQLQGVQQLLSFHSSTWNSTRNNFTQNSKQAPAVNIVIHCEANALHDHTIRAWWVEPPIFDASDDLLQSAARLYGQRIVCEEGAWTPRDGYTVHIRNDTMSGTRTEHSRGNEHWLSMLNVSWSMQLKVDTGSAPVGVSLRWLDEDPCSIAQCNCALHQVAFSTTAAASTSRRCVCSNIDSIAPFIRHVSNTSACPGANNSSHAYGDAVVVAASGAYTLGHDQRWVVPQGWSLSIFCAAYASWIPWVGIVGSDVLEQYLTGATWEFGPG